MEKRRAARARPRDLTSLLVCIVLFRPQTQRHEPQNRGDPPPYKRPLTAMSRTRANVESGAGKVGLGVRHVDMSGCGPAASALGASKTSDSAALELYRRRASSGSRRKGRERFAWSWMYVSVERRL